MGCLKRLKQLNIVLFFTLPILTGISACPENIPRSSSSVRELGTNEIMEQDKPTIRLIIDLPKHKEMKIRKGYFHELGENVILINKTGTLPLRLDCWAPYPIELKFSGHLTNHETTVKTFRKEFNGPDNFKKTCFIINATMESYEQITGNYTCSSVENPKLSSSYYIFVSPTLPGVLLTRGQKITIQPNFSDKVIVFPCAVSHPDVHVQLYQDNVLLHLSNNLHYDPKVGFTMKFDVNRNSVYGNYSCVTELSSKDQVNITLIPPKVFTVDPPTWNIRLSPQEQINVSCNAIEDFMIETLSGPDAIPVLKNEVNYVPEAVYHKYFGRFISHGLEANRSGYVTCKWKKTNEPFAQWIFSVSGTAQAKPGRFDPSKILSSCPNATEIVLHECSNLMECRINSCIRKDASCYHHSNTHICENDKTCIRAGLLQCPSKATVSQMFFTGFPDSITNKSYRYIDWKYASHDELLHLELQSEAFIPANKAGGKINLVHLLFSCQGSNFVFSSGFKWNLFLKNETVLPLNNFPGRENLNISIRNSLKGFRSNLQSVLAISIDSRKLEDVYQVDCEAPVWNSRDWIKQSYPFNSERSRSFLNTQMGVSIAPSTKPGFYVMLCAIILICNCAVIFILKM